MHRSTLWLPVALLTIAAPMTLASDLGTLHFFAGGNAGGQFGRTVGYSGDLDGDGFDDVLVAQAAPGTVTVYSGRTGSPLRILTMPTGATGFGFSVAGGFDVDLDGTPDISVGAPNAADLGVDTGRAYCYSGNTGAVLFQWTGASQGSLFGHSIAHPGDLNADGTNDVVIGAEAEDGAFVDQGRVRVMSGATGATLFQVLGTATQSYLGHAVAGIGDYDSDGSADIAVGAHGTAGWRGAVHVVSGASGGTLATFVGDAPGDVFGTSVSSAADVDLDGIPDVLVGSMLNDGLGPIDAGSARVHAGGTGLALFTVFGEAAGDLFGCSVAGIGDVDADGHSDILIGARSNDAGGLDAGRAYVFSGASHALLGTLTGAASDHLGWSVAKTGDVNRDGDADVLVGALFDVVGGNQVGSASVSTVMCGQTSAYGSGCPGTGGFVPSFGVVGCASPLGTLTIAIDGALPGVGLIFIGAAPAQIPMSAGCSLLAFPVLPQPLSLPLFGFGPGGGSVSVAAKVPAVPTPVSFAMQAFVADAAGTGGFANTNGVLVELE
jgi:hypothetical protein